MSQHSFVRKADTPTQQSQKRCLLFCMAWVVTLIFFGISTGTAHTAFAAQASTHTGTLISSTPVAGPTGATITVTGSGWQAVPDRTPVTFDYSTDPACATSYTAVASTSEQPGSMSGGAFTGWFRWPTTTPTGAYTVCASIGSTIVAASTFTELSATSPQLTVSAPTVNVGQKETVTGSNFLPAQTSISLVLQQLNGGTSVALGTITSDANGAFSQAYTIPNNPTGPVGVIASGGGTPPILTASATFIVFATPITPTPSPTPRPTPSPTPRPIPTPTANTITPTSIQTQGQQAATPTPIPTLAVGPVSTASAVSTATPTTVAATQQSASTPTSTPGSGHGGNTTMAVIAGTLFLFLTAAIAGLFFWKRRTATQQQTSPFHIDPQAIPAASSWRPIRDPFSPAVPDPFAAPPMVPNPGGVPASYVSTIPGRNSPGTVGASAAYSRGHASGGWLSAPARVGYPGGDSYSTQNESDLLHDPLFVAIMQQTRSGLFVLQGKGEE